MQVLPERMTGMKVGNIDYWHVDLLSLPEHPRLFEYRVKYSSPEICIKADTEKSS